MLHFTVLLGGRGGQYKPRAVRTGHTPSENGAISVNVLWFTGK